MKCTTVGEYCHFSRTNIFPRTECEKRTDQGFRQKEYGQHHKVDSPLLKLPIDMVAQFPVGDALHLIHSGIVKRLLFGWRDGSFRKPVRSSNEYDRCNEDRRCRISAARFSSQTSSTISEYLVSCKLPREFQRAVRGLDCLTHWKATEHRVFLHYVGIVALRDHLIPEAYEHFLLLSCSITICSSKRFFSKLNVARLMLEQFIEVYIELYGVQYVTSNVHNLSHLVDEVEMFGELDSFTAYPFESMLGKIKKMVRTGNRPLAQVARRILESESNTEISQEDLNTFISGQIKKSIVSKECKNESISDNFKKLIFDDNIIDDVNFKYFTDVQINEQYILSTTKHEDSYFLTRDLNIGRILHVISINEYNVKICFEEYALKTNFFTTPFESRLLDIYSVFSNCYTELKVVDSDQIKCKLVCLNYKQNTKVFIPLLHTNK